LTKPPILVSGTSFFAGFAGKRRADERTRTAELLIIISDASGRNPKELLEVATDSAKRDIIGKEQAAEQVQRDLQSMSRERILPDEKTLEKVA
jgi:hypothetical protein